MNRTQLGAGAGPAAIRPARPEDQDAIREFLDGLSVQTRYLRFFAGFSPTSPSMLRILTGETGDVLLAWADGMVVGHVMAAYVPGPGPGGPGPLAHIAIVVADAWQGQGIGSALLDALFGVACAHGARGLEMDVLRENARMLGMIARRWPQASYSPTGDSVRINTPVTCATVASHPAPPAPARATVASHPTAPAPAHVTVASHLATAAPARVLATGLVG